MNIKILIPLIAIGSLFSSCKHDPIGLENQPKVCYDSQIKNIITSN